MFWRTRLSHQQWKPDASAKKQRPVLSLALQASMIGLFLLACSTSLVFAQTNNPPTSEKPSDSSSSKPASPTSAPATSSPSRGVKAGAEDVIPLLGPDGQPIFIPRGAWLEEFQKFLKSREANNGPMAPPFSVSDVSFEGSAEANEDTVTLAATLTISVSRDDGDVLVPLRLNDTTLLKKPEHVGLNEAEFDELDREGGYRCWLRGKGQHELKMTLAVPVRRQGAARRLMLRLPDTPKSSLNLNVPMPKVTAKGLERGRVRTKSLDNGRSEIQAFGPPGSLLDLTWQPLNDLPEAKPELQVKSFIMAELRAESLVLETTQVIGVLQGTFDKLIVRLPPEFELLDLSGKEIKESSVVAGSPQRVAITLMAPTAGPIELKWMLSAKVAPDAAKLPAIEGFEVEDARKQSGHVAVVAWEGVNLRKREGEDHFVNEDTLASVLRDVPGFHPPANGNGNTTVYRILKQPFRLVFDALKIEPYFSAEQTHLVRLSAGRADLETILAVRVFRGSLFEMVLPWPGFKTEGWEAVANDTPEVVEQVAVEDTPNGPQLRVRFVERKTRGEAPKKDAEKKEAESDKPKETERRAESKRDHEFQIRLTSRRAIPTEDGSTFDLSLPFVAASGQKASKVIVAPSANLEVEWTPKNEAISRPTTPDEEVLELLDSTRNVTAWRWEAGSPSFTAKVKVQQQSIRTDSLSELVFHARNVSVKQHLDYEVSFEPLSQVRLMVPRTISDRVRFHLRDANGQSKPLPPPVFTALEIDQARQCRLSLDPPQVGAFEVIAEFEVERTSETSGEEPSLVNIPVLQSSDAEFTATRVEWKTGEKMTASLDDPAWKPELGIDNTSLWKANGAKNSIAVKVVSAGESALQDFTVHRALIRTVVSEGRRHSQALYELDRDVSEITLTLPPEILPQQFRAWWNNTPVLLDSMPRDGTNGEIEVRLRRPETGEKPATRSSADSAKRTKEMLWLDYYAQEPTHFGWSNQHHLVTPKFASTVWVAQTIWEVVLPSDQHLLTTPRDFATQFHWQRSLLLWARKPNFGYDRIERVLNEAAPEKNDIASWDMPATAESGNVYPLSCFGPPQTLVFWSMSRSAVVGCGAGLALLLGFLLIRIPATRHVLTFLVVGFVMALAALWFAEPVKVLLQPAILGAAMAVIAAVIDRVGRRERQSPMVTLSSPSDFYAGSSSGVRLGSGPIMVDASTAPPQIVLPSEPISASGSASGGRQ